MVVWLIGMSGAGKTAIGKAVYKKLKTRNQSVVFLDGDSIREVMGNDLGHTIADRRVNAGRISRLCKYLDRQGIDVVCAVLSIFPDWQSWNREYIPQYFEVYIRVPFEILVARETKGLYRRALAGDINNVVGVDIDFPEPVRPDLVIDNSAQIESFDGIADQIIESISLEIN